MQSTELKKFTNKITGAAAPYFYTMTTEKIPVLRIVSLRVLGVETHYMESVKSRKTGIIELRGKKYKIPRIVINLELEIEGQYPASTFFIDSAANKYMVTESIPGVSSIKLANSVETLTVPDYVVYFASAQSI